MLEVLDYSADRVGSRREILSLTFGIVRTNTLGWGSPGVLGLIVADDRRRMAVRANADNGPDAANAIRVPAPDEG